MMLLDLQTFHLEQLLYFLQKDLVLMLLKLGWRLVWHHQSLELDHPP
jgi:hypothetical protein